MKKKKQVLKDTTDWTQKSVKLEPKADECKRRNKRRANGGEENLLGKVALGVGAGIVIGTLIKGVKDSDYYD